MSELDLDAEEFAPVHVVQLQLCDPCIDGEGDECHTPGCSLWLNRPPDIGLRDNPSVTITTPAEPQPAPELAVTASRLGYALAALREIAEPSDEAAHDIARNALDDDKAIREGSAVKATHGLAEPVTVAGVLCTDYPSVVAAMQAEIDRERTEGLHLAAGRDEARSDFSRLRSVLLDDSRSDAAARRRCLAIIATAGTPPVGVPLDVQRKHRPGDCQCTPCRTAAAIETAGTEHLAAQITESRQIGPTSNWSLTT